MAQNSSVPTLPAIALAVSYALGPWVNKVIVDKVARPLRWPHGSVAAHLCLSKLVAGSEAGRSGAREETAPTFAYNVLERERVLTPSLRDIFWKVGREWRC